MTVIPAINETDFEEIKKKIQAAQDFGASWVHLDVSDGKFTKNKLWNNPKDLASLNPKPSTLYPKLEVHLMVENPDALLDEWLDAGVKRLIVHLEAVVDLGAMKMKCAALGVELFVAVNPETSVEKLSGHEKLADGFLILAVTPGKAGQKFQENQLEKIKILREKLPNVILEVDGGVNLKNALEIKNAGADILVSASYIWNSGDPKEAYNQLLAV